MATSLISAGILFSLFPFSYAATHSLKYQFMATSGIPTFPQFVMHGYIDDIIAFHYDNKTKGVVPRQEWMKDWEGLSNRYWDNETEKGQGAEEVFKLNIGILKERFNQTKGVHTVQYMYGCQWDDESGNTNAFKRHGYDGEDFLSLDVGKKRWIAPVAEARVTADKWNRLTPLLQAQTQYLTKDCTDWLKKYVQYGNSTLIRTVRPTVSVFKRQGTGQVFCHATGFYPEGVMITWRKDGVELQENMSVEQTLPNEDGTFQKRTVLQLSHEELQGMNYTCEVAHKSGIQTLDLSSTPPHGYVLSLLLYILKTKRAVIGIIFGLLIFLSFVFFVIYKLWRRKNCDHLRKNEECHEEDIQSSKHQDPASEATPDMSSVSDYADDSESTVPSPDQPLMEESKTETATTTYKAKLASVFSFRTQTT